MRLTRFLDFSAMRLLAALFHFELAITDLHRIKVESCCSKKSKEEQAQISNNL